jgi:hypothetical protein
MVLENPFILVVETTPRSKKTRYLICKIDKDFSTSFAPFYRVWAVGTYPAELARRVEELNIVQRIPSSKGGN